MSVTRMTRTTSPPPSTFSGHVHLLAFQIFAGMRPLIKISTSQGVTKWHIINFYEINESIMETQFDKNAKLGTNNIPLNLVLWIIINKTRTKIVLRFNIILRENTFRINAKNFISRTLEFIYYIWQLWNVLF